MTRFLPLLPAMALCACASNMIVLPQTDPVRTTQTTIRYTAIAGHESRLTMAISLNPDCTVIGIPSIRVPVPPVHGTAAVRPGNYYPTYAPQNQRAPCDFKPVPGVGAFYQPAEGYLGPDTLTLEFIYPDGFDQIATYTIAVK